MSKADVNTNRSILIVDRDDERAQRLSEALSVLGYSSLQVDDCHAARSLAAETMPDGIIVGKISNYVGKAEFCASLRGVARAGNVMIVVLLSERLERLRIQCLEQGADFCLADTTAPEQIVRRISSFNHRSGEVQGQRLVYKRLSLDPLAMRASADGVPLPLRPKEYQLLRVLMEHPEQALSRADLMRLSAWGASDDKTRVLDFAMFRLRRALASAGLPEAIKTVRNLGYKLMFGLLGLCTVGAASYLTVEIVAAEEIILSAEVHERHADGDI